MTSLDLPLLGRSRDELSDWVEQQGQPRYRGGQLHEWLYKRGARSWDEITVLPKAWREGLTTTNIGRSQIHYRVETHDGTVKYLLRLADDAMIETVGIPTEKRLSVCVSTQVGCPMACDFCATGKGGFLRNLLAHEIIDQVLTVQSDMARRVSHLVFMGMGEPLLNVENVVAAVRSLNQDVGIGQRNITISTVGVPNTMKRLAAEHLQATLAVSLHAPTQELRASLIPSARKYSLESLLDDCRSYVDITGRRISFEYTLLAGVNDSPEQSRQLAQLIRGFQSHVNLIPYNPIGDADYQRPDPKAVQLFARILEEQHITVTVRRTRGLEANAACGQLRASKTSVK